MRPRGDFLPFVGLHVLLGSRNQAIRPLDLAVIIHRERSRAKVELRSTIIRRTDNAAELPIIELRDVSLSVIQAALAQASAADAAAVGGEADRGTAAQQFRTAYTQARPLLDQIIIHLKSKYVANLADLAHWGLKTKVKGAGTSVIKPSTQSERLDFLMAYVTQEQSLPAADRVADPPLATMQALADALQQTQSTRTTALNQRESGVEVRDAAVQRLLDLLQLAAAVLVMTRFNGCVTNDLQQWGYIITARPAKKKVAPTPQKS